MGNCAKIKYNSRKQALWVGKKIEENPKKKERKPTYAYLCPNCNGWHLTSKQVETDIKDLIRNAIGILEQIIDKNTFMTLFLNGTIKLLKSRLKHEISLEKNAV